MFKILIKWWKAQFITIEDAGHHPACMDCNHGNEVCYKNKTLCLAMQSPEPFNK